MLLIWDPRFSTRTEQGFVQVIDSSTGEVQVSAGDYVEAGGGSFPRGTWLKQPIPKEYPGTYWLVGEYIKKIDDHETLICIETRKMRLPNCGNRIFITPNSPVSLSPLPKTNPRTHRQGCDDRTRTTDTPSGGWVLHRHNLYVQP